MNPVITSAEMNKRREDVVYTCAAIMNRPKPRPKPTDSQPASGTQTPKEQPPKKEKESASNGDAGKDDLDMEGPDATIEEMDVD